MNNNLKVITTTQFEKDVLLMKKLGKNIGKLKQLLALLVEQAMLPKKYCNHKLKGNFSSRWECHIEPDWLLIYHMDEDILKLERTGTHSDLF